MADILAWYQGNRVGTYPRCEGGYQHQCPVSSRLAREYNRGYFTLSNVINPNPSSTILAGRMPIANLYDEVEEGDTLWLAMVPPQHHVYDVGMTVDETLAYNSSIASLDGMSISLVTAYFEAAEDAEGEVCSPQSVRVVNTMSFRGSSDAERFYSRRLQLNTAVDRYFGVGIRINSFPNDAESLNDVHARLAAVVHAMDYEAQTHM